MSEQQLTKLDDLLKRVDHLTLDGKEMHWSTYQMWVVQGLGIKPYQSPDLISALKILLEEVKECSIPRSLD